MRRRMASYLRWADLKRCAILLAGFRLEADDLRTKSTRPIG